MPSTKSTPARTFNPEPGSVCHRILGLLARNDDEGYTSHDLQLKFDCTQAAITDALAIPVAHGLVRREKMIWCAGPALAQWQEARQGAPAAPKAAPTKPRDKTCTLDVDAVPVLDNVPLPPPSLGRRIGGGAYARLFARLKPGQMAALSRAHTKGMLTWAKKHAPGQLATRVLAEPIDGAPMGVWRLEPGSAEAAGEARADTGAPRQASKTARKAAK